MRRTLALLLLGALALGACATHPDGAYFPTPRQPATAVVSRTLERAALAAGDDPERYSFGLVKAREVRAWAAPDATFYVSEALARQPQPVLDALVAQAVAHEVLGHEGKRRTLSLSMTAGFTVLGIAVPGLSLLDFVVNPLVVRAYTREQERDADRRAVQILEAMGHAAPRRTLAAALRAADAVNGPPEGGLLAAEPDLDDRLARLEPLEPLLAARSRR
jgi:Zn-dependent protease with chaperone function